MALKVNEYFGGDVKSIGFDGTHGRATVGVMNPGSYEFSTTTVEVMTVIDGAFLVRLPGKTPASTYRSGEAFRVAAGETFHLAVSAATAYHCLYL